MKRALLVAAALWPAAAGASSLVSVEAYGNLHAGGVVAVVSGDTDGDARVVFTWLPAVGPVQPLQTMVRVDATRFAGSLFDLQPGTVYQIQATLSDPDGVTGPVTLAATLTTRAGALPEPTVATLYVAPNGDDGNPGTSALPLRTIQAAANRAAAGTLVLVQPGVYREAVTVPASGTSAQPIVFRGNGPGAILDGADAAIAAGAAWTPIGAGVHTRVTGFATGHVVTDQGRLFRYGSLAALQALAAGAPGGFYFDGTTLHVKFADASAPAARTMHVARREDGLVIDGRSFVRVEDLEIRHFGAGDFGKGVYLRYANDCAVRRTRIHEVGAAGVWVKGGSRHRIEDNEMWDTSIFGWPWDLTKGSSAENNAVVMTDDVGRGHVVRGNRIRGFFNGIGPCGGAAPPGAFSNETDVYDNELREHTDDALEPEGYCANVRLFRNRIRDVHMAFAAAPAAPGPLWIVRNVAYRWGNTRTSQQDGYVASALKVNSGFPTPIGPVLLYHNTLVTDAPGTDGIVLLNPGSGSLLLARNNLIASARYVIDKVNPIPWDGNSNDLFTTDPSRFVRWLGTRYDTLAAYRAALGQEPTGLSAAPLLVSPATGDFTPGPGSPLIDRGIVLPGINDGFNGPNADIGAVETAGPPALSIADVIQAEGTGGTVPFEFAVSLDAPSASAVTVQYTTASGTASAGSDYTAVSGMLTFAPGETAATVPVSVAGDTVNEADETFTVSLNAANGATVADGEAVGTIVNDDAEPSLSVADAAGSEGSCTVPVDVAFDVALSPASGRTVTVDYAVLPGTATPGGDYVAVSGTLTFPPSTLTRSVIVPVLDDLQDEPAETFTLRLSHPQFAALDDPDAVGTIIDGDGPPAGFRGELGHGAGVRDAIAGANPARARYHLAQRPYASYEVVADEVSGDLDPIALRRLACNGDVLQTGVSFGGGSSRALRWENGFASVANQAVELQSGGCTSGCGSDDVYRLRAYETTGSIPRVNNTGSQTTVLVLQNTTGSLVQGHVQFWEAPGAFPTGAPMAFSLAPRASLSVVTRNLLGMSAFAGSATVTHDGPYGAIAGKAVALEPATGFAFDTPLVPRRR